MDYPGKVITKNQVTPTQISATGVWTVDDVAAAVRTNTWPVAGVPNPISKSLRFNSADSAYLNRTPGSAGNRTTWTWSGWVKRSAIVSGTTYGLFSCYVGGVSYTWCYLTSDLLDFGDNNSTNVFRRLTTQVFRDVSAWYHIVCVYDSGNATAGDRVRVYVNGVRVTSFSVSIDPTLNAQSQLNQASQPHYIGAFNPAGNAFYQSGYLTEINFIDGQALTPSSFGMTNPQTGQWIPLKYSGTYGTNGFYLNFKDATSTTTLGYDYSGNANNWTTNNFSVTAGVGNDSLTDVPTPWVAYNTTGDVGGVIRGNYCTLNPLYNGTADFGYSNTLTNGNLQATAPNTSSGSFGTILVSTGKWYFESTITTVSTAGVQFIGVNPVPYGGATYLRAYAQDGNYYNGSSWAAYGATYTTNDVIGLAVDLDSQTIEFFKNGTSQGQKTSIGLSGISVTAIVYNYITGSAQAVNFGQRPFAYTPPTGFRSLCTTNLPATAIGFGLTNQASKYMNVALYTGNGSSQSITGVGFQPDFTWIKSRSGADNHNLFNAVVGLPNRLFSNLGNAENTTAGTVTAFNSDGFSVGSISDVNANGVTFVGWNWNAGGSTVTNTSGTISAQVRANTTAGFSIISYTGNKTSGATIGHGLGVAPAMVIIKERANSSDWIIYHQSLGATQSIYFTTAASNTNSIWFNNTAPSSTVITLGNSDGTNRANTMIAYAFAAVAGYSAFGSYTGNGSADGPFVYLGFRPKYLLIKNSSAVTNWFVYDSVRDTYNIVGNFLRPNLADAEGSFGALDFVSNGFKIRDSSANNSNGQTHIYAAFAEYPFQFANAR